MSLSPHVQVRAAAVTAIVCALPQAYHDDGRVPQNPLRPCLAGAHAAEAFLVAVAMPQLAVSAPQPRVPAACTHNGFCVRHSPHPSDTFIIKLSGVRPVPTTRW